MMIHNVIDSNEQATRNRANLDIPRWVADRLGREAVRACDSGDYCSASGRMVNWRPLVNAALAAKQSLPPYAALADLPATRQNQTHIRLMNETTFAAAQLLHNEGHRPLSLNFASGRQAGGHFLRGGRAQEETLCRSSALYPALLGDEMFIAHTRTPLGEFSDWAIYTPAVPVFRADDNTPLEEPWLADTLSCAAPVAMQTGLDRARELLRGRIQRVLHIAASLGYTELVLGAWGCGAYGNDPVTTATDFREALEGEFAGVFGQVAFAITDWSPNRKFLGPFAAVFGAR